ncbi:hypothetical protein DIE03_06195 [Burkholderia sp. Bp8992]|nr:hypothetical protein DIE03_06195 [Burkholderia sp. Bp8992]
MPQAWPSKSGGSLAAMMLDADNRGGNGPSLRAHAVSVACAPPHGDSRAAIGHGEGNSAAFRTATQRGFSRRIRSRRGMPATAESDTPDPYDRQAS